jgi:hypothetical protein
MSWWKNYIDSPDSPVSAEEENGDAWWKNYVEDKDWVDYGPFLYNTKTKERKPKPDSGMSSVETDAESNFIKDLSKGVIDSSKVNVPDLARSAAAGIFEFPEVARKAVSYANRISPPAIVFRQGLKHAPFDTSNIESSLDSAYDLISRPTKYLASIGEKIGPERKSFSEDFSNRPLQTVAENVLRSAPGAALPVAAAARLGSRAAVTAGGLMAGSEADDRIRRS